MTSTRSGSESDVPKKVIVLGGGIGGMSAAHELCERGFAVTVFELKGIPGGKARSIPVPTTGTMRNVGTVHLGRLAGAQRRGLPGEHGYRFFPGSYRHIIDTMQRTPYRGGSCADNLVATARTQLARFGHSPVVLPNQFPQSLPEAWAVRVAFKDLFDPDLGISEEEYDFFAERTWQIFTSCEERRNDQYEKLAWWDFIGAESRSELYQKVFARGGTQSLIAARAEQASTKTIGNAYLQYYFNVADPGVDADRVLNGPTSDVWIQPWLDYLRSRGVEYQQDSCVRSINCAGGRVRGATIERQGKLVDVVGDYYVAALPVEVMATLVTTEMVRADPGLANIVPLSKNVAWQNGIQIYLTEDIATNPGHVIYVDSPWSLTSVSQKQFWSEVDLSQYGDGRVRGVLSVDVSDWSTPGLNGKPAQACTREEIKDEVWQELKLSLNVDGNERLRDEHLHSWFLDPDVDPTARTNSEPLLVNLVDSWRLRPDAVTRIPNLFLASDYVRTDTDLACMEGANEAARRAVNGIIDAEGMAAPRCRLWKLHEPDWLGPWRAHDRARYQRGLPWDDQLIRLALAVFSLVQSGVEALEEGIKGALASTVQPDELVPYLTSRPSWRSLLARWPSGGGDQVGELVRAVTTLAAKAIGLGPDAPDSDRLGEVLRSLTTLAARPPSLTSESSASSQVEELIRALASSFVKPPESTSQPREVGTPGDTRSPPVGMKARVRFVAR
jgi:uncharacterized protein with NAD-binding domain and iron-sulfur cluster